MHVKKFCLPSNFVYFIHLCCYSLVKTALPSNITFFKIFTFAPPPQHTLVLRTWKLFIQRMTRITYEIDHLRTTLLADFSKLQKVVLIQMSNITSNSIFILMISLVVPTILTKLEISFKSVETL